MLTSENNVSSSILHSGLVCYFQFMSLSLFMAAYQGLM